MTVAELIEKLNRLPPAATVALLDTSYGYQRMTQVQFHLALPHASMNQDLEDGDLPVVAFTAENP